MNLRILFLTVLLTSVMTTSAYAEKLNIHVMGWGKVFNEYKNAEGNAALDTLMLDEHSGVGIVASYDKFSATFIIGPTQKYIKKLFASYQYSDDIKISVGQQYVLTWFDAHQSTSNSVGEVAELNRPMLSVKYNDIMFQLITTSNFGDNAVISFDSNHAYAKSNNTALTLNIPRLEVAYLLNNDMMNGKVFASYGAYLFDYTANSKKERQLVNAYSAGFYGNSSLGDIKLEAGGWVGVNQYLMGQLYSPASAPTLTLQNNELDVKDALSYGGVFSVGYAVTDSITPRVGVGFSESTTDGKGATSSFSTYVQTHIKLNKYFAVVPEVSYSDGNTSQETVIASFLIDFGF